MKNLYLNVCWKNQHLNGRALNTWEWLRSVDTGYCNWRFGKNKNRTNGI